MSYGHAWGLDGEAPPFSDSRTTDHRLCAQRIGRVARRLIEQDCSGQVLAVVTGAIYLITEEGELCWLALLNLPMHARAISVPSDLCRIRQGTRFETRAGRLNLEGDLTVNCPGTATWDPPTIHPDRVARPEQVLRRIKQLRAYIQANGLPDRANSIVHDIESACWERDWARMVWSSQGLIGMGPGLTPSGDDFVGGLIFTLHSLRALYPDLTNWNQQLVHPLLDYARTRTTNISYHLLRDYADGQAAEPLHRLLADILSEETTGHFADSARQTVEIGNTSGGELLAGVLTAMRFLDHRGDSDDNRYQTAN